MTALSSDTHGVKRTAFILGLDENGYGTLRSLAAAHVPTLGIWDDPAQNGRFSRYGKTVYLDLSLPETEVSRRLIAWRSHFLDKPVLFATSDRYAHLLAMERDALEPHFAYHWVHTQNLSSIVDKAQMSLHCQRIGTLIPQTHVTQPGENLRLSVRGFPFPCLVKPIRSFATKFPVAKNFFAVSPEELLEFYKRNPGLLGLTIWQEIIEGDDHEIFQCTTLIRESGEIGPLFVIRKIHQFPPGFGNMCFGRSEENKIVVESAMNLLRSLDYRGFASLEFKRRARDGHYYFIEMNPRLPWYNALFRDASVNFALLAYLDLTHSDEGERVSREQKNDVYWIHFVKELGWLWRTRDIHRTSLFRWLMTAAKTQSFAWWSWQDPMPFVHSTGRLLSRAFDTLGGSFRSTGSPGRVEPIRSAAQNKRAA